MDSFPCPLIRGGRNGPSFRKNSFLFPPSVSRASFQVMSRTLPPPRVWLFLPPPLHRASEVWTSATDPCPAPSAMGGMCPPFFLFREEQAPFPPLLRVRGALVLLLPPLFSPEPACRLELNEDLAAPPFRHGREISPPPSLFFLSADTRLVLFPPLSVLFTQRDEHATHFLLSGRTSFSSFLPPPYLCPDAASGKVGCPFPFFFPHPFDRVWSSASCSTRKLFFPLPLCQECCALFWSPSRDGDGSC